MQSFSVNNTFAREVLQENTSVLQVNTTFLWGTHYFVRERNNFARTHIFGGNAIVLQMNANDLKVNAVSRGT